MALAAVSLLVPRNRCFGRVERWAFWRRESVRGRVRDRRGLDYLYVPIDGVHYDSLESFAYAKGSWTRGSFMYRNIRSSIRWS
jgi:hypothetical protein